MQPHRHNKPVKNLYRVFFHSLIALNLGAQNPGGSMENAILDANILSVQLRVGDGQLASPIVDIKAMPGILKLHFDHLGDELMDYDYTIVHCNHDWSPSDLDPTEYIDGYSQDRITAVTPSFNTLTDYTQYTLELPNRSMRWTRSGNYLLKIFDTDADNALVLVRRFMVVEPLTRMDHQFVRPAIVEKLNTHHEFDFSVTPLKNFQIANPQRDLNVYVLQNGRWDNKIGPLKPFITRGDQVVFDFQDQVIFPAGKEFRFFDLRSLDFRGEGVKIIVEKNDYYEITLRTDESRFDKPVLFRPDADGKFLLENTDLNRGPDYCEVLFSIKQNAPFEDQDVYVFGELTDWQLKPEYKMSYVAEAKAYTCLGFLRQGYYNYQYVVVDRAGAKLDTDGLEGNWYETLNQYTVLTYYRPQGARFDRLVGAVVIRNG